MERIARHNKKGMSLLEVLIALVILMVVSLALMQTALLGIRENLRNSLRDEAVNIAEQRLNELRNTDFNSIALVSNLTETAISRTFRAGAVPVDFTPTRKVTLIGSDAKQIAITVSWSFAGQTYAHNVTTIMRQQ